MSSHLTRGKNFFRNTSENSCNLLHHIKIVVMTGSLSWGSTPFLVSEHSVLQASYFPAQLVVGILTIKKSDYVR